MKHYSKDEFTPVAAGWWLFGLLFMGGIVILVAAADAGATGAWIAAQIVGLCVFIWLIKVALAVWKDLRRIVGLLAGEKMDAAAKEP